MASQNIASLVRELTEIGIPFKTPADPDWAAYSSTYNLRLPVTPAAVVVPTTVLQVSSAVKCAGKHGFKVQARSGGHSYASYSNGGVDGAVVIDLRDNNFRTISATEDPNCVIVGGGTQLGKLAHYIDRYTGWRRALPHGTCLGVGVGGHFTHGGYGLFSRAWGLAMDRVAKIEVVCGNGALVLVDKDHYPDLFYAMRGAADSFGIAVAFHLYTVPAPKSVILWNFTVSDATKSVASAVMAIQHIQAFVHNSSAVNRKLGLCVTLASNHLSLQGTYLGHREDFMKTIMPGLLEGSPEFSSILVQQVDWATALKQLNHGHDVNAPTDHPVHSNFFAKSVTIPEPGFTVEQLTDFFKYLFNEGSRAPVSYFILLGLYGGTDSQISIRDHNFSAFAHRDALWVAQLYGYVDNDKVFPQEGLGFINGLANAMTARLPHYGAYSGYTDPSLSRGEANDLYYGREIHQTLKKLKMRLDPDNVFANPQSIDGHA
ncbi:putative glucooligosaccharide oxidase [Daldinia caldariorum]|uniref:putative glucooligosaccharide oxidase n=1 Tax=Daldinia caldariorum TaxID=326644 RepID=UPI002008A9BC|nr:putative glucooligosaccharide oxidase [Daldinia caldariorum]KAI1463564.1 putative glucooligosaccharide oxidase [Daldinia caldariorum]